MSESNVDNAAPENTGKQKAEIEAGTFDRKNPQNNDVMRRALDILSGKDETTDDNAAPEGEKKPGSAPKGKPKTLADAAERLGLKIEDIYALEVAIEEDGESEKFSLGALKDAHKERTNFKLEQLQWGEDKAEQEGQLLRSRNEIVELLAMMPKEAIKPEVINKIREKHDATLKLERERTLSVIPSWKNETSRVADLGAMREHLNKAGFPANYLDQVSDHRTMRYIRENMLREQRIAEALAMVKLKQPKGQAPSPRGSSNKGPSQPTIARRGNTAEGQKVSEITKLLTGLK